MWELAEEVIRTEIIAEFYILKNRKIHENDRNSAFREEN